MSQKKGGGGLRRPPQPASNPDSFLDEAGSRPGSANAPQPTGQEPAVPKKEPIHTFNLRIPVSEHEHLVAWAQRVSPRDSVHALVLKAIREKLDRLDRGDDES